MIHRVIYGSIERFLGILIEHYAGAFPIWLAPVQMIVIPIADRHLKYAEKIQAKLLKAGLRIEIDGRSERLEYKIRQAELQKIPYMIILGDREAKNKLVSVRPRGEKDLGQMKLEKLLSRIQKKIKDKK